MKTGKRILSVLLSVIMALGVCAVGFTVSADDETVSQSFYSAQAVGSTHCFTVNCSLYGGGEITKYLKVVKTGYTSDEVNNLTVYEAESLTEALSATGSSYNLTGRWINGDQGEEVWQIGIADSSDYFGLSDFYEIPSVSISYGGLSAELPKGTARYFTVEALSPEEVAVTRYLKVTKSVDGNQLTVSEGESLAEAADELCDSTSFAGTWSFVSDCETWTVYTDGEYLNISDLHELTSVSETFAEEQAVGTEKYFTVNCLNSDETVSSRYLKVIKAETEGLSVFEADSLEDATESDTVSTDLIGRWDSDYGTETWTISIASANYKAIAGLKDAVETVEISDYAGLLAFANRVNSGETNLNAILTADIDASVSNPDHPDYDAETTVWTPIGKNEDYAYTGTFDGMDSDGVMHTITGLTYNNPEQDNAGLFGYVGEGGKVQNVGLEGGKITGKVFVGGVVGENIGIVENCSNAVSVTAQGEGIPYAGGIVGYNYYGTVINCYNTGEVSSKNGAGGVVGYNRYGTVENCFNTGTVKANGKTTGAGGVVADIMNGTIINCFNTGDVTAITTVTNTSASAYAGGIFSFNGFGTVTNCYNTGDVTATAKTTSNKGTTFAGGLAGDNTQTGSVSDCFNTGNVNATAETISDNSKTFVYAGGVSGKNRYNCTLKNCYSAGNVTAAGEATGDNTESYVYAGGAVGYNDNEDDKTGIVENCYYDRSICVIDGAAEDNNWKAIGNYISDTVTGLATVQMTGANALDNMVFQYNDGEENPWLVKANDSAYSYYPHLRGFDFKTEDGERVEWPAEAGIQMTADEIEAAYWPPKYAEYPLWVGGTQVTSKNMDDLSVIEGVSVAEGGYAKFEVVDGKNILSLKDATITGTQSYKSGGTHDSNILVENKEFNITINLEGENTLGPAERGIWMANS